MFKFFALFFLSLNLVLVPVDAIEKEKLQAFFREYDESQEKKEWKWERLPYAIEKGYVDVAEFFILRGDVVLNYWESFSITWKEGDQREYQWSKHPLMTAMRKNYINLAILLIQHVKNLANVHEFKSVDLPYSNHQYAYSGYVYNGSLENKNAMHIAIADCENNKELIEALILAGLEIEKSHNYFTFPYKNGEFTLTKPRTPLQLAITLKKLDTARLLLANDANVDFEGQAYTTPLMMAVNDNYIEGVSLLLSYGADPLKLSHFAGVCLSPLELAMQKGHWDIVDLLLDVAVKDGKVIDLHNEVPKAPNSYAYAINDHSDVIIDSYLIRKDGQSVFINGSFQATDMNYFYRGKCLLDRNGKKLADLNGLWNKVRSDKNSIWWALEEIVSLNDTGEIITRGRTIWGEEHAVLLTPVKPE